MSDPSSWPNAAGYPIALLPVRLETRWLDDVLLIRVIPDSLHIDTFEPELTDAEAAAGRTYWAQVDAGTADAAWAQLTGHLSVTRAAWVARSTRPGSVPAGARSASWTRPPIAVALPTRWTATARLGDEVVRVTGNVLTPATPEAGLDPQSPSGALPPWMVDFTAAVDSGMGLRLPLGPRMAAARRVDLLLVYGVDESLDPPAGAQRLSELLDAHYYTDGLSYLSPGTPTNNTDVADSGYGPSSPAFGSSYQVSATDPGTPGPDSAAARLTAALGLPVSASAALPAGSGAADETVARAMNDALWATTWGYFLRNMLVDDEGEEARRLDHTNVIANDAYLRYLDRRRLWPTAQRAVIASVLGADPGDPGGAGFAAAWQQAIARTAQTSGIPVAVATQQLIARVEQELTGIWRQQEGDDGTPADDWAAATARLQVDRTARFAYFRWLNRTSRNTDQTDTALADWLAGENAARYGPGTARAARAHFVEHVRPGGHLPTLLVGRQPYAILPATSLDLWRPGPGDLQLGPMIAVLRALRDTVWQAAAGAMPRLGATEMSVDDANAALLDIMGSAAVSPDLFARIQLGPDYLRNLYRFVQPALRPDWATVAASASESLLDRTGIVWAPRVARLVGAEASTHLTAPTVTAPGIATANWLATLADPASRIDDIAAAEDLPGGVTPILYRLLRHSLLREYADAVIDVLHAQGELADWLHLDLELIGIRPGRAGRTAWSDRRSRTVDTAAGSMSVADYLESDQAGADADGIHRFQGAAARLASVADGDLARHLMQTIDTTSHRLDAWITSVAARRLEALRDTAAGGGATGSHLGGYGWVTDLRPAEEIPPDLGFVQAPSVAQATTAAVLRSGYDSHLDGSGNPFAINLSSRRVRAAAALLEAVRAGQAPGAALGHALEQGLQTSPAGQYIGDLRALAPSPTIALDPDGTSATSGMTAGGVVDGLTLAHQWRQGDAGLGALLDRIAADDAARGPDQPPVRPIVEEALDALDDTVDATTDALLADAVHHTVNGAPTRAAATLDLLARGGGSVAELDSLRTPRHGTPLLHRVALLTSAGNVGGPHWPPPASSPRAAASPELEMLLQQLLPDPAAVGASVTVQPRDSDPVAVPVTLAAAAVSAVDCVLSCTAAPGADGDAPAELLVAGFAAAARAATHTSDPTAPVVVDPQAPEGWSGVGLDDAIRLFRLLRDVVTRGRPLTAADLAEPGAPATAPPDLSIRADAAVDVLGAVLDQLGSANVDQQRGGLRTAAAIGIVGAAAASGAVELDPGALAAITAELIGRRDAATALPSDQAAARIQAALGADLSILTPSTAADPDSLQAAAAVADREDFAPRARIRAWLAAAATVRESIGALRRFLAGRRALRLSAMTARTLQLPVVADGLGVSLEPWIGGAFDGRTIGGSRWQTTYLAVGDVDLAGDLSGILLDDWVDTVPDRVVTTGLAYRYPTPSNQPPQAIVLAVAPDGAAGTWSGGTLESILIETLDLATLRAVDPDALTDVGQILPAAYLAFNPAVPPDTVSTMLIPPPPTD